MSVYLEKMNFSNFRFKPQTERPAPMDPVTNAGNKSFAPSQMPIAFSALANGQRVAYKRYISLIKI